MEQQEKKTIKLIVLANQSKLISQIDEVGADIGEPDCKLTKPYEVILGEGGNLYLNRWLEGFTPDDTFMMRSDKLLTLTEPTQQILDSYNGQI